MMFEGNRYDIEQENLFRSVLEEGQEPVPVHVWEGIENGLNRIARRRTALMWMRRSVVAAAAAAVAAIGLFFPSGNSTDIVNPYDRNNGMVAVVGSIKEDILAYNEPTPLNFPIRAEASEVEVVISPETTEPDEEPTTYVASEEVVVPQKSEVKETETYVFPDVWPEDESEKHRRRVRSVTLSGVTGTNGTQNNIRVNPMSRPALSSAPQRTGIRETSTNTTYGIPVSFGAGIRFNISERWSIGTGLNYTLLSRKFFGTYTSVDINGYEVKSVSSDIRESQQFIGIPLNFYFDIISHNNINFYTYAGGAAEKCVADRFHVLNTNIIHTEDVEGFQFSANAGIGVEFLLGRHLGIYVDPSIRYYFKNGQPKSIRTVQPLMFGLEMGLRFNL